MFHEPTASRRASTLRTSYNSHRKRKPPAAVATPRANPTHEPEGKKPKSLHTKNRSSAREMSGQWDAEVVTEPQASACWHDKRVPGCWRQPARGVILGRQMHQAAAPADRSGIGQEHPLR